MPGHRPTLRRSLSRLLNRVRARGPSEVVALAKDRLKDTVASNDALIVFTRPSGGELPVRDELVCRPATPTDASRYASDIGTDSASSFRARLSNTTHCFIVLRGDLIVHSSWVTTSAAWTREVRAYVVPPSGGAYIYESFTRPEVRGRGVYPFALLAISRWAGAEGTATVWVAVEADNPASVRAVEKAGFEEAFRLAYRRRWGRLTIDPPTGQMAHVGTNFVRSTV